MLSFSSEELLVQTVTLLFWYKGSAPRRLLFAADKLWKKQDTSITFVLERPQTHLLSQSDVSLEGIMCLVMYVCTSVCISFQVMSHTAHNFRAHLWLYAQRPLMVVVIHNFWQTCFPDCFNCWLLTPLNQPVVITPGGDLHSTEWV